MSGKAGMPVILRGDTARGITLSPAPGYDYGGCTLEVELNGARRSFDGLAAGEGVTLDLTADETARMPLGAGRVHMRLRNDAGEVLSLPWAKVKVTDAPGEVRAAAITIDPATLDVEDATAGDSLGDVKGKLNAVLAFLRGAAGCAILAALPCMGLDVAPLYTTPNDMPGDSPLMTNAAEYVDAKVSAATNGLATAEDVNSKADKSALESHVSDTKNPHNVTAAQVGALTLIEDEYGRKTAVTIGSRIGSNSVGSFSVANGWSVTASGTGSRAEGADSTALADYSNASGISSKTRKGDDYAFAWNGDELSITEDYPYYTSHGVGTFNINPVGGLNGFYIGEQTLSSVISDVVTNKADKAEVDSAIHTVREDNEQTRQIVTTWENFLDGSNVVFSITNYLSGTYSLDAAKMTIKELREGEYREVYNSRDEILLHIHDFMDNDFRVATNQVIGAVNAAIGNKADKDWGKYTSAGGEAPENTVYMTAPNTVFAGGLEYERVAVGEGTICVLTTHGAPVWTQGDEGTFKFQDDGGTNYFGFAKTDSYTIGANTDGITVQSSMVTMNYNITMSGRPCVWYKADLTSNTPWEQLNLPDGSPVAGASHAVTWEQNPTAGTQVCYINVGNQPQGFFRATVEVAGEAKFITNMPADLSGGIICTNTATGVNGVIKPTFNGTTVQWDWMAQ